MIQRISSHRQPQPAHLHSVLAGPATDIISKHIPVITARPSLREIPNRSPHSDIMYPAHARLLIPEGTPTTRSSRARSSALGSRVHSHRCRPGAWRGCEAADAARQSVGVGARGPLARLAGLAAADVEVQPVGPAADLAAVAGALAVAGVGVGGEGLKGVQRVASPAFAAWGE